MMEAVFDGCLSLCGQVDDNIGLLISELKQTDLWGRINILITSDHGMTQCSAERVIQLDDCLHPGNYTLVDRTPVAALIPLKGNQLYESVTEQKIQICF